MEEILKRLCKCPSPSGYEDSVREEMAKTLKNHVDSVTVDKMGNLVAKKGNRGLKIMLAAHMDEIGLITKYISKEGFIYFDKVGGIDDRTLLTRKVRIYGTKGSVVGVIGCKPPHLSEKSESEKPIKAKSLFIDIGAKSDKEVKGAGIRIGDFVSPYNDFNRLLGSKVTSNGFDNRIGCAILLEVAKRFKRSDCTLYLVGTVKEEIGLVGIRSSTFGINPDLLIAVDTCIAGDMPEVSPQESSIKLGAGPALDVKDAVHIIDRRLRDFIEKTASKAKIPIQHVVMSGGATDASIGPIIREGVISAAVTVPTRYLHTPVEIADLKDIENCVKLCVKIAEEFKGLKQN